MAKIKNQLNPSDLLYKILGINIPNSFKTNSFEDFDILKIPDFQTFHFSDKRREK